ncbi:bcl-2-like protein 10 [Cavia porcellus]|uniref:bcl-2-like protein 10 n=1 Tax=Cavia porcellus TaxID=10141 RepID=UPI000350FB0C|nr:bcl-2-like protein 10 [Cavia porcellus]
MEDALRTRTEQVFADYLEFCAREPHTPGLRPRNREAAALRTAAEELRRTYRGYFARYQNYNGNCAELLDTLMDALLPEGVNPTWLRMVTCAALAGTLLQHPGRRQPEEVTRDCERLVGRLTTRFARRHRAWLESRGGWEGFCLSLQGPLPLSYWKARLFQTFMSCILATVLIYLWTRVYRYL